MRHCPHCGERVDSGDAYCFECGSPLDGSPESAGESGGEATARERGGESRRRGRGYAGNEPARGGDHGRHAEYDLADIPGRVSSLTTLWVAAGLAVLGVLESLVSILLADALVDQAAEFGFGESISTDVIVAQGVLGLVVTLVVAGVCVYYYRQGYLDRLFFWALVVAGIAGFLFAGGFSAIGFIVVGVYGLAVALRRNQSPGPPPRGR